MVGHDGSPGSWEVVREYEGKSGTEAQSGFRVLECPPPVDEKAWIRPLGQFGKPGWIFKLTLSPFGLLGVDALGA